MMKKRVLVAMSGGVDSSVAAALLKEKAYDVVGATIKFWSKELCGIDSLKGCCNLRSIEDARLVAGKLNIPYYVFNLERDFKKEVINYFVKSYTSGFTPNPCIICNERIKWGAFLDKAKNLDADFIATGHYAKVEYAKTKRRYLLKEATCKEKDQSYVLFSLTQDKLARTILPLGDYIKSEVRHIARKIGLANFDKEESQDICFIPSKNREKFFDRLSVDIKKGPIKNNEGKVLGEHKGIVFYTVGQREGLGLTTKQPVYVTKIDAKNNSLTVGPLAQTKGRRLVAQGINWISIDKPRRKIQAKVQIRYKHPKVDADIFPEEGDFAEVVFKEEQFAITPGQAVVFYNNDVVIGGGWIE